jgi:hypothetical protein
LHTAAANALSKYTNYVRQRCFSLQAGTLSDLTLLAHFHLITVTTAFMTVARAYAGMRTGHALTHIHREFEAAQLSIP